MQYELYIHFSDREKIVEGVIYDSETKELIIGEGCDIISDSEYNFHNLFNLLANNNNSVYVMDDGKEKLLRYDDVKGIVCNNSNCECKVLSKSNDNKTRIIEIKVTNNNITASRIYYTLKGLGEFHTIYYNTDKGSTELRNGYLYISDNDEFCQLIGECHDMIVNRLVLDKLADFSGMHYYKKKWEGLIYVLCQANDEELRKFCENFIKSTILFIYDGLYVNTSLSGSILYKSKIKYEMYETYKIDENGTIIERERTINDKWGPCLVIPT